MPSISYERFVAWSNYHLTRGDDPKADIPAMRIDEVARVHAGDVDTMGLERFGRFADKLLGHMRHLKDRAEGPEPPERPVAGPVGQAWSFSPLIGTSSGQLMCDGMSGISPARADDLHPDCPVARRAVAFALGGTRLREIATWAEARGRGLATSGTHLGPTIAGGFGTASHGSKLGYGGLQNMVMGIHLVTGEDKHVWLEPKSRPVLSDTGLGRLQAGDTEVALVRDDARFEDALVHLGAMGIVVGVALELPPRRRFAKMVVDQAVSPDWLEAIGRGEHAALAKALGCGKAPVFHELTLDPLDPFGASAIHTMYFRRRTPGGIKPAPFVAPADAIARYAQALSDPAFLAALGLALAPEKLASAGDPDDPVRQAIFEVLHAHSAYEAYKYLSGATAAGPFDPEGDVLAGTWSEIHNSDVITGGIPGALYNASFAVPRADTAKAVAAISAAVIAAKLPAVFVFTLRFVTGAAGSLAFTRFAETTAIEIDGISNLACKLAVARLSNQPDPPPDVVLGAILGLGPTLSQGARAVRAALDGKVDYAMHWAKLGDLDRAKVLADYAGPLPRWRETREFLLTDFGRKVFWNEAAVAYGLVDGPA
jgi:hypothetical protein